MQQQFPVGITRCSLPHRRPAQRYVISHVSKMLAGGIHLKDQDGIKSFPKQHIPTIPRLVPKSRFFYSPFCPTANYFSPQNHPPVHFLFSKKMVFAAAILVGGIWFLTENCRPTAGVGRESDLVDFNWHVRPILSDRCFKCHVPDEKKREAGLRLDTEEGAFAALGTSATGVPSGGATPESAPKEKKLQPLHPTRATPSSPTTPKKANSSAVSIPPIRIR